MLAPRSSEETKMAHLLLDRLRDGALVPYPVVTAALIVTGDIPAPKAAKVP